jgi:hypothetical protein
MFTMCILANVSHRGLIEFEDTGIVSFRLKRFGAPGVLHYTTSSYQKNMEGSITIFAEHATIKIGGQYLNTIDYQPRMDLTLLVCHKVRQLIITVIMRDPCLIITW